MLYEPLAYDGELDHVYIPVTDDRIEMGEVQKGCNQMRKGGSDFTITGLYLMTSCIAPVILYVLNLIFLTGFSLK